MAEIDNLINEPSEAEKRIKQLSGKVKEEAEGRAAEVTAREAAEVKAAEAQRSADFYQGYADVVAANPAAKDHKEDILAKVKTGYTVEDATFAVLGKAGKLGQPRVEERAPIAGGSATNSTQQSGSKTLNEMSLAEKRAAILELVSKGDISLT